MKRKKKKNEGEEEQVGVEVKVRKQELQQLRRTSSRLAFPKLGSWQLSCDEIIHCTTQLPAPYPAAKAAVARVDWPTSAAHPPVHRYVHGY